MSNALLYASFRGFCICEINRKQNDKRINVGTRPVVGRCAQFPLILRN